MKNYFLLNHATVILCSINILIDWEGQTYDVKLIVDCIDFAFYWVYMAEVVFRLVLHSRYMPGKPFERASRLEFALFGVCTCGQIY